MHGAHLGACAVRARHVHAVRTRALRSRSSKHPDSDSGSDDDTYQVASRAAAALGAAKLIFLSYSRLMTRTAFVGNATANSALASQQPASSDDDVGLRQVQSMRLGDAKRLVQDRAEALERAEESCNVELSEDSCGVALDSMASCTVASVLALCGHCVAAHRRHQVRAPLPPNPNPDP